MPILLVPYTLGTDLSSPGAPTTSGAAYYTRRKRYMAYMLASFLVLLCL